MRLVEIQMHNFGSYADEILSFADLKAACIQGANGAGKSTIPDAILYAFTGKCSRGNDGDLIRIGTDEMFVRQDFRTADESPYRIIRKMTRNGTGVKNVVELKSWDGAQWTSDSAGKAANARILSLLGRDYELLTQTSFLLQDGGRDIIGGTPKSRHQVIFKLLGLEGFEQLRKDAHYQCGKFEARAGALRDAAMKLEEKVKEGEGHRRAVDEFTLKLASLQEKRDRAEKDLFAKQSDLAVLQGRLKEIDALKANAAAEDAALQVLLKQKADAEELALKDLAPEVQAAINQLLAGPGRPEEMAATQIAVLTSKIAGAASLAEERKRAESRKSVVARSQEGLASALLALQKILDNREKILKCVEDEKAVRASISQLETEVPALKSGIEALDEELRIATATAAEIARLQAQVESQRQLQSQKVSAAERRKADILSAKMPFESLLKEAEQIRAAVSDHEKASADLEAQRGELSALRTAIETDEAELRIATAAHAEVVRLQTVVDAKKKEHAALVLAAEARIKDAETQAAPLDGLPCHGEGKFASCPLIAQAIAARDSLPELKEQLAALQEPLVCPEEAEMVALQAGLVDLAELQGRIRTAKATVIEAEAAIKALEGRVKELSILAGKAAQLEAASVEVARIDEQVAAANKEIELLKAPFNYVEEGQIVKLSSGMADVEALQKKISAAKAEHDQKASELASAQSRLQVLVTWTSKADQIESAEVEKARLETEKGSGIEEMKSLDDEIQDIARREGELVRWIAERTTLQQAAERVGSVEHIAALAKDIQAAEARVQEASAAVAGASIDATAFATLTAEVEALKVALQGHQAEVDPVIASRGRAEALVQESAKAADEIRRIAAELDTLNESITALGVLEGIYQRAPFVIMRHLVPFMEDEANRVLAEISETGMRIRIELDRDGKDEFHIIVSDVAGERPIESYSGGEKTRLALALIVGRAELSARKAGIRVETLLIDEPAGLDAQGMVEFGLCFRRLVESGSVKLGLLMAHDERLLKTFQQAIIATKDNGVSTLRKVA